MRILSVFLCAYIALICSVGHLDAGSHEIAADAPLPMPTATGRYMVAIQASDAARPAWREVAQLLRVKHDAGLIVVPDGDLAGMLPTLREWRPRYLCLVASPEALPPDTAVQLHRLSRALDDDPYADLSWGILTGYDADDAKRVGARSEALLIRSGYSSMGPALADSLGAGFATSETDAATFWLKHPKRPLQAIKVPADPTVLLAEAMEGRSPDFILTSGRASTQSWEIGYTVSAGRVLQADGQLVIENPTGQQAQFSSSSPKVYLAAGNSLIGRVDRQDCMVTAWMHSGGVHQMVGYTTLTIHGYMGWGVRTYFERGDMSLSQSFMANNQALIHRLQTRYPEQAAAHIDDYQSPPEPSAELSGEVLGLVWDRDAVALYGDPAWVARMPMAGRPWSASWHSRDIAGGQVEVVLTIRATETFVWGDRPLILSLPQEMATVDWLHHDSPVEPLVTDDFVLLALDGQTLRAGSEIQLIYRGLHATVRTTSWDAPVIDLSQ